MEDLFKQLMQRAGAAGGEDWLRRCLEIPKLTAEDEAMTLLDRAIPEETPSEEGLQEDLHEDLEVPGLVTGDEGRPPKRMRRSREVYSPPLQSSSRRSDAGRKKKAGGVSDHNRSHERPGRSLEPAKVSLRRIHSTGIHEAAGGLDPTADVRINSPLGRHHCSGVLPAGCALDCEAVTRCKHSQKSHRLSEDPQATRLTPSLIRAASDVGSGRREVQNSQVARQHQCSPTPEAGNTEDEAPGPSGQTPADVGKISGVSAGGGARWDPLSESFMGLGFELISENIKKSVAPKTWAGYAAAWRDWILFCNSINVDYCYSEVSVVLFFVSDLMQRQLAYSSVNRILAGISFFLKLFGYQAINNFFPVKQMLKGYRKSFPAVDKRRPISMSLLSNLWSVLSKVCFDSFELCLFRTAFVLAFFAAFRIGELVSDKKSIHSGLFYEDVRLKQESVEIFLKRSKTDQLGRGCWIKLNAFHGSPLCPVANVRSWLALRPVGELSFLIHKDLSPITKFQFNSVLKKCLRLLDLGNVNISSHSFRIGAATEAARMGLDESIIKKLGRWESDRFKLYVRPSLLI
ncbi:uncharacterized protein [Ranitomeya imitator]|uniref:uncharacterized protein n=1 Tax=Ranitomeya imitator TaxID=111125 RepID=UPI0037E75D11